MALDLDPASVVPNIPGGLTPAPLGDAFRVDLGEDRDRGAMVLALHGEADIATAPVLTRALSQVTERGTAHVVLDAASLDFIDACCLGVIADARTRLRGQGRDLVVRSPTPLFHRVLTVLEMEDLIEHAHEAATG